MASRLAKTPLAIADAQGAAIMFANEAFATLVGLDAAALAGRPLGSLAAAPVDIGQRPPQPRLRLARARGAQQRLADERHLLRLG